MADPSIVPGAASNELRTLITSQLDIIDELRALEGEIFAAETAYLEDTWYSGGNLVQSFDNYIDANRASKLSSFKRPKITQDDRLFSSSSLSAPIAAVSSEDPMPPASSIYNEPYVLDPDMSAYQAAFPRLPGHDAAVPAPLDMPPTRLSSTGSLPASRATTPTFDVDAAARKRRKKRRRGDEDGE